MTKKPTRKAVDYRDRIVEIIKAKPADLEANPHNWRLHPKAQAEALKAIMGDVGRVGVLLAYRTPDGALRLIDGHLRREVDPDAEWFVAVTDLDESEAAKVLLTFDPLAAMAYGDASALASLQRDNALPLPTGEGLAEIFGGFLRGDAIPLHPRAETPPSPAENASGEAGGEEEGEGAGEGAERESASERARADALSRFSVEAGQIWTAGPHRLACGDSLDDDLTDRLFKGAFVDTVFSDPPYNLGDHQSGLEKPRPESYGQLDAAQWDRGFEFGPFAAAFRRRLKPDATVWITHSEYLAAEIWEWAAREFAFHSYGVWCKPNPFPSLMKRRPLLATELFTFAVVGKPVFHYPVEGHWLNWIVLPAGTSGRIHPTQKPVDLVVRLVGVSSPTTGATVYDPSFGSGTTIAAAQELGISAFGVERDPGYFAAALARLESLGLRVEREG